MAAQQTTAYAHTLHESTAFVVGRILVLQLLIGLAAIIFHTSLFSLFGVGYSTMSGSVTWLLVILGATAITLQTIDVIILIVILVRWLGTTYIITPHEITIQRGILRVHYSTYRIADIEWIAVQQSWFNRLFFNVGSIVFKPASSQLEVCIRNIRRPKFYNKVIKDFQATTQSTHAES